MKTVFMFSGQGAQYAGMGKELYQNYAVAKDIFDRADAVLGYSIKDICFQDEKKLGETEFAQPAILTMSIAAMKVLEEQGVRANMTAGLSLGEYSAYVASGAMDFEETVALVQKRGRFMTEAVPSGEGAMYAIIGLDQDLVEEACEEATALGMGLAVPANYNAPGQIVIAGKTEAVAKAENFETSEDDLNAYAQKIADSIGAKAEDVMKYFGKDFVEAEQKKEQARKLIVDSAIPVDEAPVAEEKKED